MIDTKEVLRAHETQEGSGARVKRLFPQRWYDHHDPFVLLDEFFVDPSAGFPDHPHRGFEAVTYMKEGSFRHCDNIGNDRELGPGGVQRFTAGKGIVHSEMPGSAPMNHGFQLWINLPRRLKGMDPSYQAVESQKLPEGRKNGMRIRTLIGPGSPVWVNTDVVYQDYTLASASSLSVRVPDNYSGLVYAYAGKLEALEFDLRAGEAVTVGEGEELKLSSRKPSAFLLIAGRPHMEVIHHNGPFVD
jgi:redox-sensitive bicupin YhaK (pirin superfamily)